MTVDLPNPQTAPQLFEGVIMRRAGAFIVDSIIIGALTAVLFVITGIIGLATLGLGLLILPLVAPFAVLLYYIVTLGSPERATLGMRMFDIVLTPTRGAPLDGWKALIHPVFFWITIWIFWPLLLICFFTPRQQLLHDMVTGTMMVRRSPMTRHWADTGRYA